MPDPTPGQDELPMNETTKEMRDWFGNGEADVDLMLALGIVKHETIVKLWQGDPTSPGYVALAAPAKD